MNMFSISWLKRLAQSKWFPLVPQLVTLIIFALIVLGGWGFSTEDSAFAKILRNTNFANLIVWSYWWPLIIVATILIGRLWCTVCPVELLAAVCSKIGLKRKVPSWLRSGWIITVFYMLILLVGVHTLAIHRQPHRMSLYMLVLISTAVLVALIFEKRAFCSYVCPVGHLLGLYSLLSPFEWRADDLDQCQKCKTKDCISKKNYYNIVGRSCTSNLYPAKITDNRECLLCTQCLKVCPYKNLRFSLRKPGRDLLENVNFTVAQMTFLFVVAGFVIYEILSEWSSSKAVLTWLPTKFNSVIGAGASAGSFLSASVMFLFYPAVFILGIYLLLQLISKTSFRRTASMLCVVLLPTMAAGHILKSLLKTVSRIPYWKYVFSDPIGVSTATQITDKSIVLNKSIPDALYSPLSYIAVIIMIAALVGILFLLKASAMFKGQEKKTKAVIFFGSIIYWAIFAVTIFLWRF